MRSSLDSVVYLNGKVTCAGWAAPEMAGDEVCLTIRKEDGSILDAQVSRVKTCRCRTGHLSGCVL